MKKLLLLVLMIIVSYTLSARGFSSSHSSFHSSSSSHSFPSNHSMSSPVHVSSPTHVTVRTISPKVFVSKSSSISKPIEVTKSTNTISTIKTTNHHSETVGTIHNYDQIYYHSSNNLLWWCWIYNQTTHKKEKVTATSQKELSKKIKNAKNNNIRH